MKVSLIISAPISDCYGFNLLASQLKRLEPRGVGVSLFYIFYKFNEKYPQEIIEQLVNLCNGSDLIGVSLLSSSFKNSIQITKALKENINCPVVWGGKHPTVDPQECIKYADIVALSEGEDTLIEIVEAILDKKPYDGISGIWVKKNDSIIKNPLRPVEMNLDRFLFPDYSLKNKYILDLELGKIRLIKLDDLSDIRKRYPTMITRGCPNCCTFCTNSIDLRLRNMRARSVGNVIKEVKEFLEKYPDTERVMFRDDCLSAMPLEYIKEFSERWKKEVGLQAGLSGVIATSDNFKEKIELLTDAGFRNFKMGIQSGCERVRRFVFARVGETDKVINNGIRVFSSVCKGKINYYMITDNPYETEDELIQSIIFTSMILRPFSLSLFSLNYYPGTALYNRALKDGYLKNKEDALQESTMEMKNTYLNKVFISLRYFALPPTFVKVLTSKRIYSNKLYQYIYNKIFKYIFNSETPSRGIKAPTRPIRGNFLKSYKRSLRWFIWEALSRVFNYIHKTFVN